VAGSTGVLLPPAGYLKRIREICSRHGILLVFDEVVAGFGRLGAPFAVDYFGIVPDLMSAAKGLTNGAIPVGAIFASLEIHDGLMQRSDGQIELFDGYTYSGHPAACAARMANLEIFREEGLFTRVATIADQWQEAMQSLRGLSLSQTQSD
jgi:beta-alanine--pyruvate transaminase